MGLAKCGQIFSFKEEMISEVTDIYNEITSGGLPSPKNILAEADLEAIASNIAMLQTHLIEETLLAG